MAIYRFDGTTNHEIDKKYRFDDTTSHQISKEYRFDGANNILVYEYIEGYAVFRNSDNTTTT